MSDIKYEIVQKLGVLSTPALSRVEGSASGWSKELNLISWNDREPTPSALPAAGTSPKYDKSLFVDYSIPHCRIWGRLGGGGMG